MEGGREERGRKKGPRETTTRRQAEINHTIVAPSMHILDSGAKGATRATRVALENEEDRNRAEVR